MTGRDYLIIIAGSALTAVVTVVVLKLLNVSDAGQLGGGVAGGVSGAIAANLVSRKKNQPGDQ